MNWVPVDPVPMTPTRLPSKVRSCGHAPVCASLPWKVSRPLMSHSFGRWAGPAGCPFPGGDRGDHCHARGARTVVPIWNAPGGGGGAPGRCRPPAGVPEDGGVEVWPGGSYPLGATYDGRGTNFALFSEVAQRVQLCLFDEAGVETRVELTEVDGFIWHCFLPAV